MGLDHFVTVERSSPDGREIHLIHKNSPQFSLQLTPEYYKDGSLRGGTIKSIRFPNSWAGDYHKYSGWIARAERYFKESLEFSDDSKVELVR